MQTYRIEVRGSENESTAIFEYSVHGNVGDMSLNLRFSRNFMHSYSVDDATDIIKWISSRKWLNVLEVKLIPFSS